MTNNLDGCFRATLTYLLIGFACDWAIAGENVESESMHDPSKPASRRSGEAFPLPEVAVKGRRIEAPESVIVRTVDQQDLESRNAITVADALTLVPGVNVQIGGTSGDARAWVRGYRDYDVLVLYDGIPIASGFEGTVDLNEVATQRIAQIKVMKSAPSVIYGTNAVGGVIDIVPESSPIGFYADGLAQTGTDQRLLLTAGVGHGNGNHGYAVSVQHQSADNYSLASSYTPELNQGDDERVNSDFDRNSLLAQYSVKDWALGETSVFINLTDGDKGLAVETGVDDPDFERLSLSRRQTLGLSHHLKAIPLSFKLFYNGYDSEISAFTDETFSVLDETQRNEDYAIGAKVYSTLQTSPNNTLILSASGQKNVFTGEVELEQGNKAELATYTLAAENQYWISQTLSLAIGGIYSYIDQTLLNKSSSEFNPQLALAWQASEQLAVHASAAQRTRFPYLREFYRPRYGNPDLQPQTANNYEIGLSWQHTAQWTSDVSIFKSDIDGLIQRVSRRERYTNLPRLSIDGIEAYTLGELTDELFFQLAYTLVNAAEALPGGVERQLRSRPKHTVMAEIRYQFSPEFELAVNTIYVDGLYDLDPDDNYVRLSAYAVTNLVGNWTIAPRHRAYLAVNNLGDEDYVQRIGDPRPGRSISLGYQYQLN